MSFFPKRRVLPYRRSQHLTDLDSDLADSALPGRFSRRILDKTSNKIGQSRRQTLTRMRRRHGDQPYLFSELESELNRGTAETFADAALSAETAEEQNRQSVNTQRLSIAMREDESKRQVEQAQLDADFQNQSMIYDSILGLLGGATDLGASMLTGRSNRRLLEMLFRGDSIPS